MCNVAPSPHMHNYNTCACIRSPRRRLGALVCDLLMHPSFPPGLVADLLAQQCAIWPQESYRYMLMYMYVLFVSRGANLTFLPTDPKHQNLCICIKRINEPNSKFYLPNRKFTSHGPAVCTPVYVIWLRLHRIEKLTEIIAELRHPSSVETTNLSETQFANITHLDLKV